MMKNKFIIIIDGPDCSGKTHIAKKLCDVLNLQYFKNPSEKKRFKIKSIRNHQTCIAEAEYLISLLEQVSFGVNGIVFDRHIPSHYSYSVLYKREFDINEIFDVDRKLAELGAVFIYCRKTITKEWKDELVPHSDLMYLYSHFEQYKKFTVMRTLSIDTSDEDLRKQIESILKFIFNA